jgi:DNA-binding NarL/FixJ family response regulator
MNDGNSKMIRVCLVEDDDKIRESLIILIEGTDGFRCVGAYESAEEALRDIKRIEVDVVLMDINLPGMSGIECVQQLKSIKPTLQIIMLTVYEDSEKIFTSLEAGASGYLLKRTPPDQLLQGIRDVHSGGSPMSAGIARKVVESFKKEPPPADTTASLTDRETEILDLLSKGKRNKEIADTLFISPSTVHTHIHNIYEKLHIRSRSEAILKHLQR